MLEFIAEALVESVFGKLLALLGRLLKAVLLLLVSPYLVLRGWLRMGRQALPLRELYIQGRQAAAFDLQIGLSVLVCLPLLGLLALGVWQAGMAVLAWVR